jgi:hypothetical protein
MLSRLHKTFRKLEADTDENLFSYFKKTVAVTQIADQKSDRVIGVGLKGIGKTAAFRYFTDFEDSPDIRVGINIYKYGLQLPNKDMNYAVCCKQFEQDIVIEALYHVTQNRKALTGKLSKHYLDAAAKEVSTYREIITKAFGKFGGISVLGCGFTIHHSTEEMAIGLTRSEETSNASRVLKEICDRISIRIVVDDPEWVFSVGRELDTHLIGGFCLAALRCSDKYAGLKVVPLLKTHVYYPILLQIDDLGKYPDHMERLCWTRDELFEVIDSRLKAERCAWKDLFQGSEKDARRIVADMCLQVRNGPRDLLRWLDLALQASGGNKLSETEINQTFRRMSEDSFNELVSANSVRHEKLGELLRAIFRKDPNHKYSPVQFKKYLGDLRVRNKEFQSLTKLPWMQLETSESLPDLFFKTGAIAFEAAGNLVLPYEKGYDPDTFRNASSIQLVPCLSMVMT